MASMKRAARDDEGRESARQARRETIEMLIEEMGTQSFPASYPPAGRALASGSTTRRERPGQSRGNVLEALS
jgi:hypothetical protein